MRPISAVGPTDSPLLALVGEAPGEEEQRRGEPFVGSSGMLLNSMLSAAGISRSECYITNVIKTKLPRNDFGTLYEDGPKKKFPKPELVEAWRSIDEELRRVRPKVIVPLGAEALKAITGYSSIKNHRGLMIQRGGLRILPTYHPAYILRGMDHERPIVELDLAKAMRQARNPYTPPVNFNINPTFDEAVRFLRRRDRRIALDIETFGITTRMIGFAWDRFNAIVIPLIKGRKHAWSESEEQTILHLLGQLLASWDVEKVIQNFSFDYTVLAKEFGFQINNIKMDTMVAHHLLYPELPKGLDFLCSLHTDHPMYWDYNKESHDSTATYCSYDNVVTFEVADEIESQLREREMWDFYQRVINPAAHALLRIQSRGVKQDLEARQALHQAATTELDELYKRLQIDLGREINPWSPKQVSNLLYNEWKLPPQKNSKTKKVTTDDDALEMLIKKTANPMYQRVLRGILNCRKRRVYISTFLEMELRHGRVYTNFNISGTVTGRLASSSTIEGLGGNLQNFPRGDPRRIFIADDGKLLIKADLSQAEYRVLIWKARIERVIDRLLNDKSFNIHMWNASENIYRVPISQVTKTMYSNAKNGVYGANYNMGYIKVSRMYNLDLKDAKFILERYHEAVPEVQEVYQAEIRDVLHASRRIRNPLGRERLFLSRFDDELYRSAYSHYCQSTVADLINLAMIDLEFSTEGPDVEILLQVHDELLSQCPIDDIDAGVEKVRKAMEREIMIEGRPLVIPVEIKVGRNWAECVTLEEWKKNEYTKTQ